MKIRIMGIDPALRNTGIAIFDYDTDTGDLEPVDLVLAQTEKGSDLKQVRKSSDDLNRARILRTALLAAIAKYSPQITAAEVPQGTQDARASFSNGVCTGLLASLPPGLIEVNPNEVKMAAVGSLKHVPKAEMIRWATTRWPTASWLRARGNPKGAIIADNEHLADACAVVEAAIYTPMFAQAVNMVKSLVPVKD